MVLEKNNHSFGFVIDHLSIYSLRTTIPFYGSWF